LNPFLFHSVAFDRLLRAQWSKVSIKGNGAAKRKLQGRGYISSLFDHWDRFFLSLDGVSLYFFESKNISDIWLQIPASDFKKVRVEQGFSTKKTLGNGKMAIEDTHNVILSTNSGDEISFRF